MLLILQWMYSIKNSLNYPFTEPRPYFIHRSFPSPKKCLFGFPPVYFPPFSLHPVCFLTHLSPMTSFVTETHFDSAKACFFSIDFRPGSTHEAPKNTISGWEEAGFLSRAMSNIYISSCRLNQPMNEQKYAKVNNGNRFPRDRGEPIFFWKPPPSYQSQLALCERWELQNAQQLVNYVG